MSSNQRVTTESKWLDIKRRSFVRKDSAGNVTRGQLPHWYGRMKVNGKWKWFKLFTDKRASQARWAEIIQTSELKDSGVITSQMDAAKKPLSQHVTAYLESLKRTVSDEHHRIASYMLNNFIELAGWKTLADINEQSASRTLSALQATGKTVAYTNQYLARVKAFLNWCIPDRLLLNPLAKLKRGNAKKALKRRARRPLAEHELAKLLSTCRASRRLKYAIPAYTGLRRNELAQVVWGDLHLDSTIPYLQLRPEQTKTGEATALPLHPHIVAELRKLPEGMPEAKLFRSLPEGRTMLADLNRAGVKQADASGRRADFHGLRHTFAKRLDESGCSHATRRALMRHGAGDQTDGYTLARLSEMYDAVRKLPAHELNEAEVQVKTGTNDVPVVDTWWTQRVPELAAIDSHAATSKEAGTLGFSEGKTTNAAHRQVSAGTDLSSAKNRDTVAEVGPRSSVG